MKERNITAGEIDERDLCKIKEAVCIQTEKVYDSCRDKDCIEDLEVFGLPRKLVKKAIDVTCRDVQVEDVVIDVEPLRFKRGYYTVTVTFVFTVCVDLFFKNESPKTRCGVALFTKKVILFGSQGRVKVFKSKFLLGRRDKQLKEQDTRPNGIVEVAEPICLAAKIEEDCEGTTLSARDINIIMSIIKFMQSNEADVDINIVGNNNDVDVDIEQTNIINIGAGPEEPRVLVTIGLFSIVKLVRYVQLLLPSFGFCRPPVCLASTEDNPCELFDSIEFPRDAFFPPQKHEWNVEAGEEEEEEDCCCDKH